MNPAGVDLALLTRWMDEQGLEQGPIRDPELMAGGTQNILLRFDRGARSFILRRPPVNLRAESNETMRREARVLGALRSTNVPHPKLIAACSDEAPLGAAFYLMEPVEGFNAVSGMPSLHSTDPEMRRAMGFALVDGAAALGNLDYRAVGLDGFGKPDGYLKRQVARWQTQYEGYTRYSGWPGLSSLSAVTVIADYLEQERPEKFCAGITHGDYSIGNVMFRNDGPQLAAIVDWELATIGDPLIDLGWLLATWRGVPPEDLPVLQIEPWAGFPQAHELIDRYAQQTERDMSHIDWYMILACFRLAILLEGSFARACAGHDPMETGLRLHETAVILLKRALYRIG